MRLDDTRIVAPTDIVFHLWCIAGKHLQGGMYTRFPFTFRSHSGPLLAAALAVAVVGAACGIRPTAGPTSASQLVAPAAAAIVAEPVQRGDIQQTHSFDGDFQARQQISVLPKTTGRIEQLMVDVGAQVKAGQTIAQLEQESAQSEVLEARAALAGAEAKLATVQAGPRVEDIVDGQPVIAMLVDGPTAAGR
jgi:HlyD family secretion protein